MQPDVALNLNTKEEGGGHIPVSFNISVSVSASFENGIDGCDLSPCLDKLST